VLIGEASAERVKKAIASGWDKSENREIEIKGRDIAEGLSRAVTLSSQEIYSAISDPLEAITQAIKSALEHTPPELSADIGDKGMVIAGGGALMRDIDRRFMEDTGLPVVIADDPLTVVARGCGRALEEMDHLGDIFAHE
jgi:rod shape-determining protein MreB